MKKRNVLIIILILFSKSLLLFSQDNVLYGDFNNDKKKDVLEYFYKEGSPYVKISLNNQIPIEKKLFITTGEYSMPVVYSNPGFITINESFGSTYDNDYIYKWIKNDWYLFGIFHKIEGDGISNAYLEKIDIYSANKLGEMGLVYNLCLNIDCNEFGDLLESTYNKYLDAYKTKKYDIIKKHNQYLTLNLLNYTAINKSTVQKYNDIAFFILSVPDGDIILIQETVNILKYVIKVFPNRTVAYINLGDAYWGLKEAGNAKNAYQKYIELMKASGKEYKIPQKVFERIR